MRLSTLTGLLSSLRVRAILAGVVVGTVGAGIDGSSRLQLAEQEYGLAWLFRLRGPRPAPEEALIIAMNQQVADNISLFKDPVEFERCNGLQFGAVDDLHKTLPPPRTGRWPRCLHAQLIESLTAAGARVVVVDILFRPRTPTPGVAGDLNQQQDERLGAAIRAAGNVLIAQDYKPTDSAPKGGCVEDVPQELSATVANAALGIAPMPQAPTVFSSGVDRADRFWTFKTCAVGWASPTLPLLALQAYALNVYPEFLSLLREYAGADADLLPATAQQISAGGHLEVRSLHLRGLFKQDASLAPRILAALVQPPRDALPERTKQLLRALVLAYDREDSGYLNYFGPAGAIRTLGYDLALKTAKFVPASLAAEVREKVVFIGYAEPGRPERYEHLTTSFSDQSGINTSGVELIATAFSNLLTDSAIRPIPPYLRLFVNFAMGFAIAAVCMYLPALPGLAVSSALAAAYFGFVLFAFSASNLWLPLIVPLCVTGPVGVLAAAGWQYLDVVRDKKRLAKSLGLFVPPHVVQQLVQKPGAFDSTRESLDCACLVTDAANYTALSESLRSEQLATLLHQYFETLFQPVLQLGGYVSDVIGDSMLALWPDRGPGQQGRLRVCLACLDALVAVERFNTISPTAKLPTRFGIHFGPVTLGLVGALTHYEYRAVGDTVNSSNLIQGLNRRLGTRLLASEPVVEGLEQLLLRDLGLFRLKGKKIPIRVFEIVSQRADATEIDLRLCMGFAKALEAFQARAQGSARKQFDRLVSQFPQDGPSAFYAAAVRKGIPLDGVVDA